MRPGGPGGSRWPRAGVGALVRPALLTVAALSLCVWQAGLTRDSPGARWSVALLVGVALVMAIVLGRGRQRRTSGAWIAQSALWVQHWRTQPRSLRIAVIVWTVLVVAVVGWDLVNFIVQSHALPTLSYFIGRVSRYRAGRGLLFAVWLVIGACLVAGGRAKAGEP
jgi:hypothetical protein